jgi:hypothetical protein
MTLLPVRQIPMRPDDIEFLLKIGWRALTQINGSGGHCRIISNNWAALDD